VIQSTYIKPSRNSAAFTCPYCSGITEYVWQQRAYGLAAAQQPDPSKTPVATAKCKVCDKYLIWLAEIMLDPEDSGVPSPLVTYLEK
jgi:hypothetical protein